MVDKLYHRANPRSSLRLIARFVVEIQRFVCDRATPPIIEKLRSKGVATVLFRLVVHPATIDFEFDQSAIRVTSLARANVTRACTVQYSRPARPARRSVREGGHRDIALAGTCTCMHVHVVKSELEP